MRMSECGMTQIWEMATTTEMGAIKPSVLALLIMGVLMTVYMAISCLLLVFVWFRDQPLNLRVIQHFSYLENL